jgi:hypothetical protein
MCEAAELPFVSIIVSNFNGKHLLYDCLSSLLKLNYPKSKFEIILVDNGSTDGSVEYIKECYPDVKLCVNHKNLGYAEGNNVGIRQANGDYIFLLNNDTAVDPNCLLELVHVAETDPNIAACQPKVLSFYNRKEFDYAGAAGGLMDIYGYPLARGRIFHHIEEDHGQYDNCQDIFWASGVAMLIKHSVLDEVGLLDDMFFLYHEETDLAWRMHLRGYRVIFVSTAMLFHKGSQTIRKTSYWRWYFLHRNNIIMLLKNYSLANLIKVLPIRLIFELVSDVKYPENRFVAIKAMFWILKNFKSIWKKRLEVQHQVRRVTDEEIAKLMVKKSVVVLFFLKGIKVFSDLERYLT